jgi:hypothetical protein
VSYHNEHQEIVMKPMILGFAAAGMLITVSSFAQTTTGPSTSETTGRSTTGTGPAMTAPPDRTGQQAASGDNNQAVATTSANAAMPAHGANSFTMAQAKSRFEKEGFSSVSNLQKDDNGVWHASAEKAGSPAKVWLDYKGNVGQAR